ncbi:MAG: APC family permease [Flavobacteriales bacterium]|nr:APC family permease [Flavobacteriales bacterium]
MSVASGPEQLQRAIGPRTLAFATVNAIVGSGIFVLPALVSLRLGAAAILAYLVCGALIFMIALCFAELGSGTTRTGGLYAYIEEAFGPYAGFLGSNIYWFGGSMLADAAIANALADILSGFFPVMGSGMVRIFFILGLFSLLAMLNIRSVKHGIRFVEFATLAKLVPLIILVVVAAWFVDPANLRWNISPSWSGVGGASLLLFYAFLGLETPLINGGEIKDARRTVPRGLLLGLAMVLLLYISIQLVIQGVLGDELQANTASPLGAVAALAMGSPGLVAITLVMFVSMTGTMGGNMLCTPRILYAAGRDGSLPKQLGRVHERCTTPYIAIMAYALIGCTVAITGNFRQLAILSSASVLIVYLGVVSVLLKRRLRKEATPKGTFRAPGGVLLPIIAASGILWLLSNLEQQEWVAMAIFVAVLSVLYAGSLQLKKRSAQKVLAT